VTGNKLKINGLAWFCVADLPPARKPGENLWVRNEKNFTIFV